MEVLCFDISSGGVSGARFDADLNIVAQLESSWDLARLDPSRMRREFLDLASRLRDRSPLAAICITSFMHGFLIVDRAGQPVSPLYSWLDNADPAGVEKVRSVFGS